jgi:hypothetical protein
MSSTVTPIDQAQAKVPKTFEIGDLVEVNKGNWIDKQGEIAETSADGTSRVKGLGWCMNEDLDLVEAVAPPPAPEPEPEGEKKIEALVDGQPAAIVLDGTTGAIAEEEQKKPPLIEVTIDELNQDWVDQYDRWAAAESEAKEAREEATMQRKRLDALSQQLRWRLRRDSARGQQTSLLDQPPPGSETPEASAPEVFRVRRSFAATSELMAIVGGANVGPSAAAPESPADDDTDIEPS